MKTLFLLVILLTGTLSAQSWSVVEPAFPVEGAPGERVLVRLNGPPGREAYLKVAGDTGTTPLTEPSEGHYQAEVFTPWNGSGALLLVELGGEQKNLGKLTGKLRQWSFTAPAEMVTRQGPHPDYDRLTPLYQGQKVTVDGVRGDWYRCRESGTWVDARKSPELEPSPLPPNRLNRILIEESAEGDALLTLEMSRCPEVQVSQQGQVLTVTLYDTYQTNFDIKRPTGVADFLGPLTLTPQPQPRAVTLKLYSADFCGYQLQPDAESGSLKLMVRKPLPRSLKGLKITLDAGHGGPKDKGTVGHGGLPEKELNLRVAKALAKKLRRLGAEVVMTRTVDTDVASLGSQDGSELQARVDRSIEAGSRLFLSLHHNARPEVSEGKVYHGTDVYWYQPHSQTLARALADPVANAVDEPLRSFRWRSFYVIRQTHSPAVLIEFQYLSNPALERSVLDRPGYPEKAAEGVVNGLVRYLSGE